MCLLFKLFHYFTILTNLQFNLQFNKKRLLLYILLYYNCDIWDTRDVLFQSKLSYILLGLCPNTEKIF